MTETQHRLLSGTVLVLPHEANGPKHRLPEGVHKMSGGGRSHVRPLQALPASVLTGTMEQ
jgi:hypothetical protein